MNKFPRLMTRTEQQEDCTHDEFDHDICIDCGFERDPGEAIDNAMYVIEGE